jgi:hypothetical protein
LHVAFQGDRDALCKSADEVCGILLYDHLAEAAACRQAGRLEEGKAHMASVNRLGAESGGGGEARALLCLKCCFPASFRACS